MQTHNNLPAKNKQPSTYSSYHDLHRPYLLVCPVLTRDLTTNSDKVYCTPPAQPIYRILTIYPLEA
jgi:hypothetical protein